MTTEGRLSAEAVVLERSRFGTYIERHEQRVDTIE